MAHPKRKTSKQRRDKRRTHYTASNATTATCSNCGATVKYHRVCPDCGYYKSKLAVEKDVAV